MQSHSNDLIESSKNRLNDEINNYYYSKVEELVKTEFLKVLTGYENITGAVFKTFGVNNSIRLQPIGRKEKAHVFMLKIKDKNCYLVFLNQQEFPSLSKKTFDELHLDILYNADFSKKDDGYSQNYTIDDKIIPICEKVITNKVEYYEIKRKGKLNIE